MHYNENEKKRWKMTHTYLASASKLRKLLGRTGVPGIYKLLNCKIAKDAGVSQTQVYHCRVKEDSIISSSLSIAKIARSQSSGKGKSSSSSSGASCSSCTGPSRYSSALDCPCPGSSYGKRLASPGHGGGGKRSRGGRGGSPSPKSRLGFRKQEP